MLWVYHASYDKHYSLILSFRNNSITTAKNPTLQAKDKNQSIVKVQNHVCSGFLEKKKKGYEIILSYLILLFKPWKLSQLVITQFSKVILARIKNNLS